MRTVSVVPSAAILVESMRDLGYSLDTALADILDNSITAGASTIALCVDPLPDARIVIIDDGHGMTEAELCEAMRPGTASPRDRRRKHDLGRFGLGLKTASFSQCRRLTVISRKNGSLSAARWDLDKVVDRDEWFVELIDRPVELPHANSLGHTGTVVIWDQLDRLGAGRTDKATNASFNSKIEQAREHLEMVFHRYLAGTRTRAKLSISLNDVELQPFDPFHSNHDATVEGTPERIQLHGEEISVAPFTLPHHSKVSQSDWDKYGRAEGYVRNQGFYVYREDRLIIHGTWFGLARQKEITKLARVRIDIPNTLDPYWRIDLKKSSAQLPDPVRDRLKRIIDRFLEQPKRTYRRRGEKLVNESNVPIWERIVDDGLIRYRVNREHPVVTALRDKEIPEYRSELDSTLEFIEVSLPYEMLFQDYSETPQWVNRSSISEASLKRAAVEILSCLENQGWTRTDVLTFMKETEPFSTNFARVLELISENENPHDRPGT